MPACQRSAKGEEFDIAKSQAVFFPYDPEKQIQREWNAPTPDIPQHGVHQCQSVIKSDNRRQKSQTANCYNIRQQMGFISIEEAATIAVPAII